MIHFSCQRTVSRTLVWLKTTPTRAFTGSRNQAVKTTRISTRPAPPSTWATSPAGWRRMTCGRLSRTSTFPSRLVPLSRCTLALSSPSRRVIQFCRKAAHRAQAAPGRSPQAAQASQARSVSSHSERKVSPVLVLVRRPGRHSLHFQPSLTQPH